MSLGLFLRGEPLRVKLLRLGIVLRVIVDSCRIDVDITPWFDDNVCSRNCILLDATPAEDAKSGVHPEGLTNDLHHVGEILNGVVVGYFPIVFRDGIVNLCLELFLDFCTKSVMSILIISYIVHYLLLCLYLGVVPSARNKSTMFEQLYHSRQLASQEPLKQEPHLLQFPA